MYGKGNPQNIIIDQIYKFFVKLGFNVVTGPEIESYYNNFEALNIEKDSLITLNDATFYIKDNVLLRSHLSPIWIRQLQNKICPQAFVEIGKVYRNDTRGSLFRPMFYQAEGVVLDKGIKFTDLKGIMSEFVDSIFLEKKRLFFTPYWHAFTRPSAKINISCTCNHNKLCPFCGGNNMVNICTAGMIDENILYRQGYDKEITGICFGIGPSRLIQLLENVQNISEFYENNISFFN